MKPTVVTSEKAQVVAREHEERRKEERQLALQRTLATREGRAVLAWLINDLCRSSGGTFNGQGPASFFNEGRRSVGIELELQVKACNRGLHKQLVVEQLDREEEDERIRKLTHDANQQNEEQTQ